MFALILRTSYLSFECHGTLEIYNREKGLNFVESDRKVSKRDSSRPNISDLNSEDVYIFK